MILTRHIPTVIDVVGTESDAPLYAVLDHEIAVKWVRDNGLEPERMLASGISVDVENRTISFDEFVYDEDGIKKLTACGCSAYERVWRRVPLVVDLP